MGNHVSDFPGTHFRLSNVPEDDRWIETEKFEADGRNIVRMAGDLVPENLGKALRSFRRTCPGLWKKIQELGILGGF